MATQMNIVKTEAKETKEGKEVKAKKKSERKPTLPSPEHQKTSVRQGTYKITSTMVCSCNHKMSPRDVQDSLISSDPCCPQCNGLNRTNGWVGQLVVVIPPSKKTVPAAAPAASSAAASSAAAPAVPAKIKVPVKKLPIECRLLTVQALSKGVDSYIIQGKGEDAKRDLASCVERARWTTAVFEANDLFWNAMFLLGSWHAAVTAAIKIPYPELYAELVKTKDILTPNVSHPRVHDPNAPAKESKKRKAADPAAPKKEKAAPKKSKKEEKKA